MKLTPFKKESNQIDSGTIQREMKREDDVFAPFENKRVRIWYSVPAEIFMTRGQKIGTVKRDAKTRRFIFFEGRNRRRFSNMTLGLFTGWYATLTIQQIETL